MARRTRTRRRTTPRCYPRTVLNKEDASGERYCGGEEAKLEQVVAQTTMILSVWLPFPGLFSQLSTTTEIKEDALQIRRKKGRKKLVDFSEKLSPLAQSLTGLVFFVVSIWVKRIEASEARGGLFFSGHSFICSRRAASKMGNSCCQGDRNPVCLRDS